MENLLLCVCRDGLQQAGQAGGLAATGYLPRKPRKTRYTISEMLLAPFKRDLGASEASPEPENSVIGPG